MGMRRTGNRSNAITLAAALGLLLILAPVQGLRAQTAGLEKLGSWYIAETSWRDIGRLPADCEMAAPLAAHYNWAYGAICMGLNVRARGTSNYYPAVVLNDNAQLDCLDSVGPEKNAALWDAGRYHLAAGLPSGQLIVWLTAPGAMPQRLVLSTNYATGTGFDLAVYPPDPPSTQWEDWFISAAYQYSQGDPCLVVESFNGRGEFKGSTTTLPTPGNLISVQYADYPSSDGSAFTAYTVFTCKRDDQANAGNNARSSVQAAWYNAAQEQWIPANFRNTGFNLGNCFIGWKDNSAYALAAFDESDGSGAYGGLQLLTSSINRHGQVATSAHSNCWLPVAPRHNNFCYLESARVSSPFTVFSDGTDIFFGWRVQPTGGGQLLDYYHLELYQGERYLQNNVEIGRFPIQGVAAAAHWSTGDPSLYWVQQGNANGEAGGLLYQIVYWSGS